MYGCRICRACEASSFLSGLVGVRLIGEASFLNDAARIADIGYEPTDGASLAAFASGTRG